MSLYGTVRCEPQKKVSLFLSFFCSHKGSFCPEGLPPSAQVSVCARVTYFHQLMLLKHGQPVRFGRSVTPLQDAAPGVRENSDMPISEFFP